MSTSSVKKIYFYCPSENATGGTELAHQGASELGRLGYRTYMFYSYQCEAPTAERFRKYKVPYTFEIRDSSENLIVLPEVSLGLSKSYKNTHLIAWWMSVDNYFYDCSLLDGIKNHYWSLIYKYPKRQIFNRNEKTSNRRTNLSSLKKQFDNHFYQSEYVHRFLDKNGILCTKKLSDYINDDLISDTEINIKHRVKRILYNPVKGYNVTKRIINKLRGVEIVPLSKLSIPDLKDLYSSSMIYIDFGNHPGKDRMLREAAINGCVVVTGKKGSAAIYEDVPIDHMFKFGDSNSEIVKACHLIHKIFLNYEEYLNMQSSYRAIIREEKKIFTSDLKECFAPYTGAIIVK